MYSVHIYCMDMMSFDSQTVCRRVRQGKARSRSRSLLQFENGNYVIVW